VGPVGDRRRHRRPAPEDRLLWGVPRQFPCSPNLGSPLKVQRDPLRWIDTLRRYSELGTTTLVLEFGSVVEGEDDVAAFLGTCIAALDHLEVEVVKRLNAGMTVDEVVADLPYPAGWSETWHLSTAWRTSTRCATLHADTSGTGTATPPPSTVRLPIWSHRRSGFGRSLTRRRPPGHGPGADALFGGIRTVLSEIRLSRNALTRQFRPREASHEAHRFSAIRGPTAPASVHSAT